MQRQIPPGRAFSCTAPTLAPTLAALSVTCNLRKWRGGPLKSGRWPSQARFWLEWGCSDLPILSSRTGADHRKSDDLRSGGTLCLMFTSDAWRSSQNGRHENANERKEDSAEL